jgi:hypothetical protein
MQCRPGDGKFVTAGGCVQMASLLYRSVLLANSRYTTGKPCLTTLLDCLMPLCKVAVLAGPVALSLNGSDTAAAAAAAPAHLERSRQPRWEQRV